ncbi:MAG: hypothetical protein ABSF94_14180 [Steroidobacteraceae bacterium]|jgi:hypothetical protein
MKAMHAGLLVAAVQVFLLGSVGGKFLIDRAHYPRVWIETRPVDPELPIRGRYLRISVTVHLDPASTATVAGYNQRVRLVVRDDDLIAVPDADGRHSIQRASCTLGPCWILTEPLAFFISEHGVDPSRQLGAGALWAEVTVPPQGPPRAIQLGRKVDGTITVLDSG